MERKYPNFYVNSKFHVEGTEFYSERCQDVRKEIVETSHGKVDNDWSRQTMTDN